MCGSLGIVARLPCNYHNGRMAQVVVHHKIICGLVCSIILIDSSARAQDTYKLGPDDQWQKTAEVDPATPEGQLQEGRKALASKQYARAENLMTRWIDTHEQNQLLPEAYLIRGDALRGEGDEYKALFDYEFVARSYAGSDAFTTACQRELEIAEQYSHGLYRKFLGMRIIPADDEAEEIFIRVQERLPGSRLAEEAGMELGDFYFERRKMSLAADAYELFIQNYPHSTQLDKARKRLIYAGLASFKGPDFDAKGLYEARARLQQLKLIQPVEAEKMGADALLARIDESDALKMLTTAQWYWHVNNPIATELIIRRLIKKYPRSVAATDALRFIPEVLPHLPKRVLEAAPDYNALRAAVLGTAKAEAKP
jgi:outer membrane protein assembly factor BamD (BamD/ComL family)